MLAAVSGCVVVLAAIVKITQRLERKKYLAILRQEYEAEKKVKAAKKTSAEDQGVAEPPGTELEGMKVEKVYLLELEDLRKLFPSTQTANSMRMVATTKASTTHSPLLRWNSIAPMAESTKFGREQPYNKVIANNECVLGQLVPFGKDSGIYAATTFLRAGPR